MFIKNIKKKFIILLIFIIAAPIVIVSSLYGIGLQALPENIEPPMITKYNEVIYEVLWINFGGNDEIRMEPFSLTQLYEVIKVMITSDMVNIKSSANASFTVSRESARFLICREKNFSFRGHWIFYEYVCAIWVSRNWTAKEALSSIADWSFFANNIWGLDRASMTYFGKDQNSLKIEEIVVLIAIMWSPKNLDPWRFPDKLLKRANFLVEKLNSTKNKRYNIEKLERLPTIQKPYKNNQIPSH